MYKCFSIYKCYSIKMYSFRPSPVSYKKGIALRIRPRETAIGGCGL